MARSIRRLEPIEHAVGTDRTVNVALYDASGDALSVSGATAEWKLYAGVPGRGRKPFRGSAVLTKTSAAGEITLTAGNAAVAIADTDLDGKAGPFWQSLEVTASNGAITCHGQGPVRLRAGI